ncbi:acyl-CoA dehydrogenase family protein [Orrella marina]|uniref:Acyl-CoA dehydrogenase n=1 Tax=Orrella marina TaxID=2163011 RepID=A0A2R4XGC9_9BURK|nr:acyl-CoA dehydrogenase family protein [Orrella marina]AWB32824.1 acyl-CoA dehydrogenase [Orrella marina]
MTATEQATQSGSDLDYARFREEVESFVRENCPADIRQIVKDGRKMHREPWARWQAILFQKGWGAPNWPIEHGGTGWDTLQQAIFNEVLAENDCPPQYHHGLRHIGPVILEFGSADQKARYLPTILDGSEWWCQGYSEPNSGSDLASLRTRAEIQGDEYVVTGQKTWTSHAQEADLMYTLVRTKEDTRKQMGISLLIIPMDSPGITVRPIRTIDGWHHVNEVFLDNVRVPLQNCIGEQDNGWRYGKFLLSRERLNSANTGNLNQSLSRVRELVETRLTGTVHRRRRESLLTRLIGIEAEIAAVRALGMETIDLAMKGDPITLQPSALKLVSAKLFQYLTETAMEVIGPDAAARMPRAEDASFDGNMEAALWAQNYFYSRVRTIYGGSDEVQKNVIARQIFGD